MTKSLIMVNRTNLGVGVAEACGRDEKPDYKKLLNLLSEGEKDPARVMWTLDLPPEVAAVLHTTGWEVRNSRRHVTGLVECGMAVEVMTAPEDVTRFVFVAPSGGILPVVEVLARAGDKVVVAGYRRDISKSIENLEGVELVYLNEHDVTRPKVAP